MNEPNSKPAGVAASELYYELCESGNIDLGVIEAAFKARGGEDGKCWGLRVLETYHGQDVGAGEGDRVLRDHRDHVGARCERDARPAPGGGPGRGPVPSPVVLPS